MRYRVIEPFKVKISQGEIELQPGQTVNLPREIAFKLLEQGKITPVSRVAYKVYSEILQSFLWVVYGPEDMSGLRNREITEAIYTRQDISELRKLPKEGLKAIHEVKQLFSGSTVQEVKRKETK